jgi:hypothetical protein
MTTTTVPHRNARQASAPTLSGRWATYRETRRTHRAHREARARLESELANYTTPTEIAELYAIADRASAEGSEEFLEILESLPTR